LAVVPNSDELEFGQDVLGRGHGAQATVPTPRTLGRPTRSAAGVRHDACVVGAKPIWA
jgi:hypothetical protein